MDTDGRWALKRGRQRTAEPSAPHEHFELVIPVFGDKNHLASTAGMASSAASR
jgi:hypothetical protein